jgi:hypothetical protein
LFCCLDGRREALSGLLREGRAGSNTTADHITVLDQALAQIPDAHRYGTPTLVRSDSAGCTQGFLAHIRTLREAGIDTCFSVGVAITEPIRAASSQASDWVPLFGWQVSAQDLWMRVAVDDVRLFFDVEGRSLTVEGAAMAARPTVVLLHGEPGADHSLFKPDRRCRPGDLSGASRRRSPRWRRERMGHR